MSKHKAMLFFLLLIFVLSIFWSKSVSRDKKNLQKPASIDQQTESALNHCSQKGDWRTCYAKELGQFVQKARFAEGLKVLSQIQDKDLKTRDCHIMAHYMSAAEYKKNPAHWQTILSQTGRDACGYGFIHGIVEAKSLTDPSFHLTATTIPPFCKTILDIYKIDGSDTSCAHIMGHILLAEKAGNIEEATKVCSQTEKKLQKECSSGVYMENFTRDNLVVHTSLKKIPWNLDTLKKQEALCRKATGSAALGCWQEISHLYNSRHPADPQGLYQDCQTSGKEAYTDLCYLHGVATLIKTERVVKTDKYLQSICAQYNAKETPYNNCVFVAIHGLLNASVKYAPQTFHYCSLLPTNHKGYCYQAIGRYLTTRESTSEVKDQCQNAPSQYRVMCQNP